MSNLLRNLVIRVAADITEAQKNINKLSREMKKAGREMTKTGVALTKGLTVPILGAGIAAVKYASDLEESTNKVNVAFGESASDVNNWSKTTLEAFGIAQGSALDMASTFGDMGTAMGQLPDTAADMSMSLTGLAGDLASFKNIGIDQAATALKGIYTGETEALKTLGIVMQENTLIAFAQAEGYEKQYKEMTQAEKVALRYAFVMDATANAQGDFERTSDGVANQTRIVTESLKQAAASIGTQLLPVVAKALKSINGLISGFSGLSESAKSNILTAGLLAAAIGPTVTIMGKLTTAASGAIKSMSGAAKIIKGGGGLVEAFGSMIGPAGVATLAVVAIAAIAFEYNRVSSEAKAATAEVRTFTQGIEASTAAYEEQKKEIAASTMLASNLADELFNLANKETLSNTEKARMVTLVEQLNDLMPELNLQIDEQTGKLNLNRVAVDKLIESKKKELLLQAGEEHLLQLYKDQVSIAIEMEEAQQRLLDAQEAVNGLPKIQFFSQGSKERYELIAAQEAIDLLNQSMQTNINRTSAAEQAYTDLAKAVNKAARSGGTNVPMMPGSTGIVKPRAYATGTDYVPYTGPAIVHEGEQIIPKGQNKGVTININGPISSERDADRYGEAIVRKLRTSGVRV